MKIVKLTMVEREEQVPVAGSGEDDNDATFTLQVTTGIAYVNADAVRSLHERIDQQTGERKPGTRIAFINGSNISVTESPEQVAEAFTLQG